MVETVSGARGPFTGAHIGPQFSALGVNQTPTEDVSIQCRDVCGLNISDRCDFVRTTPDCRSQGGYLNYLEGIFCHFPPNLLPLVITLYAFWLLYLFLILGVTAAKFFCPNLSAISTVLKLSHNVAGVTFLAFGNGAPDIFSALVAFSDPRTASLAFGALFGAGVLVTTAVAGGIAILRPFTAASRPFLRDVVFYMVAVFLAFTALYFGRVTLAWALAYLGLYVFYVVTVVLCTWIYRWQRRASLVYSMPGTPEMLSDSEEDPVSSNSYDYRLGGPGGAERVSWRLSQPRIPAPPHLVHPGEEYRPLLFYQETTVQILARALNPLDYRKWRSKSVYWRALKVFKLFAFLGFLTSALWINAAATEVVNILRSLGVVFRLSNTVLGLTLLAWGNSIGDAFSDFTLARQGYPRMAFSACFGGIILNLLVGVGLGCLLQISRSHAAEVKLEPDGLLVWVLAGALGLSLVCSLVSVPLQCFRLNKVYGFCLLLFYVNFLVVALLTEFGVIHLRSA
ncbi:mitochondrial sodium/calcium exchanger protein isoform X6 [Mirounga angustirostris]|uniref:mitochondrial sodium/calcium exchanger protein isoform X6 n=1 Tax=Mirounga angustirostris TaxID=9716 RepID=UPI00313D7CAB